MPLNPLGPALAGCLLALLATPGTAADPLTDSIEGQIDAALQAYRKGDSRVAIQALRFAAAQIEEQLASRRAALLPEPLPGWIAEPAATNSGGLIGLLTGTTIARLYRQPATNAEIKITVTTDSPLLAMMNMLMSSPLLMQTEAGTRPYTFGTHRGLLRREPGGDTRLSLMLGNRILLQIEGSSGTTQDMLEAYLNGMDLRALEKALLD